MNMKLETVSETVHPSEQLSPSQTLPPPADRLTATTIVQHWKLDAKGRW